MYEIVTEVDHDYTEISDITEEDLDRFRPLIKAVAEFTEYTTVHEGGMNWTHSSNFPYGEACRKDLGEKTIGEIYPDFDEDLIQEFIEEYLNCSNEYGFHSITRIEVHQKPVKEVLLGRK